MKRFVAVLSVLTMFLVFYSCTPKSRPSPGAMGIPLPPCLVYKTKQDYFNKVPVVLSPDRTRIVSFPDPADLRLSDGYPYPVKLDSGYLLDRRGISPFVAFLAISYDEYAAFTTAPTVNYLAGRILDDDPLKEMYECAVNYNDSDVVSSLNRLIGESKLRTQKRLK